MVVEEVVKEWSQGGSQTTPAAAAGVSTAAEGLPEVGFEAMDRLSSQPAKAFPFQAAASQAAAPLMGVAMMVLVAAAGFAELGQ